MTPTPAQVREHRASLGLTLRQYGALVYAAERTVQSWESGDREMPAATWVLVRALQDSRIRQRLRLLRLWDVTMPPRRRRRPTAAASPPP